MDNPPVNALTVAGWFELADAVPRGRGRPRGAGGRSSRAEGRGFNAGVDIKEMQRRPGPRRPDRRQPRLLRRLRRRLRVRGPGRSPPCTGTASAAASAWSATPTSSSPSTDATFGLPEVDRGALGAATHLARLVPQHKMRAMVYTAATATAAELHHFGSVLEVVPRGGAARPRPRRVAGDIAAKSPTVHPRGQGVAERHRPGRRQAQLPLRAGLHLRAQPGRRCADEAAPGVRRQARRAVRPMIRTSG